MKVRYIGSDPKLQGTTASALEDQPHWTIQLDRYPGGPSIEKCNPTNHPLCFGWHEFPVSDWEEVKEFEVSERQYKEIISSLNNTIQDRCCSIEERDEVKAVIDSLVKQNL